tara:strand:+ start:356 stop:772 length:417 start_codon:yes stop_codon:yes gene_type:complete
MSCSAIEDSTFFSSTSVFATIECTGSLAFLGFTLLNIVSAFLSNYVFSLRQQQRRMLLKVPRYIAGRESDRWRNEFYKFLYLTAAAQAIYIVQVVFIITTNLWQLLIMVVASTASDYILYEFDYVKADKYDTIRDDIQ